MVKATILNYGVGNLFSVSNALRRLGADAEIASKPTGAEDLLILPGVGNFKAAMRALSNVRRKIADAAFSGLPILGICLGMQLMFEWSAEGNSKGLGLLRGKVILLPREVKRPHMGWSRLRIERESRLLEGVSDGAWVYFNHSYYAEPGDLGVVAATASYGVRFPAVIEKENLLGTQFHPEKSGKTGARILRNLLEIVRR